MKQPCAILVVAVASAACTPTPSNPPLPLLGLEDARPGTDSTDAPGDSGGPSGDTGPSYDPFAPQADTSAGLNNIGSDLEAVLEHGVLPEACAVYWANPGDVRQKLLCGKAMFFYESFAAPGVPKVLVDFFLAELAEVVGLGFSGYGMTVDPFSADGYPLGLTSGAPVGGSPTVAYTCASCHFSRLTDGRYVVGKANNDYAYGAQLLALTLVPMAQNPLEDLGTHHPDAVAAVQPILDFIDARPEIAWRFRFQLLPLLFSGEPAPTLSREQEGAYAHWLPGTMDFLMAPLPIDDGVHTVSRTISLWGLPSAADIIASNSDHALLSWSGGATSLLRFLQGFVRISGSEAAWPADRLEPLAAYLETLRAPVNPMPPAAVATARGAALFRTSGCLDCHGGPRGAGTTWFELADIGTDDVIGLWGDPDLDGELCCGLGDDSTVVTHGIKAPRLVGVWSERRLLHNGGVNSLEALFCLDDGRQGIPVPGFADGGHMMTCRPTEAERRDLIAFLRSL